MSEAILSPPDPASAADDGFDFEISGGDPALNFANTISRRANPDDAKEHLTHFGRLVSWGVQAELITPKDEARLRDDAEQRPRAAVVALKRAIALREALFTIFSAAARGERVPSAAIDALNAALPEALASLRIGFERGAYGWRFRHDAADLTPMLAPVVRSASELLTSADLARVRECNSDTCFWLFLDHSKNGSRRWCDMKVCGNREKARRHYQRRK